MGLDTHASPRPPPHTDFLGIACRGGKCGVAVVPRGPRCQTRIEFSPHTSHRGACSGKKEPVFLELLTGPLPTARAPAGANCARRASSVCLWIMENSGQATPGSLHHPGKERERSSSRHGRGRYTSLKGWLFLGPQSLPASDPGLFTLLSPSSPKTTSGLPRSSGVGLPGVNPSSSQS